MRYLCLGSTNNIGIQYHHIIGRGWGGGGGNIHPSLGATLEKFVSINSFFFEGMKRVTLRVRHV